MNDGLDQIRETIRTALKAKGIDDANASKLATGRPDLVRKLFNGSRPRSDQLKALCESLDLEFYVGPPRTPETTIVEQLGPSEVRGFEMTTMSDGFVRLDVQVPEGLAKLLLTPEGAKALADQLTYRAVQIEKKK